MSVLTAEEQVWAMVYAANCVGKHGSGEIARDYARCAVADFRRFREDLGGYETVGEFNVAFKKVRQRYDRARAALIWDMRPDEVDRRLEAYNDRMRAQGYCGGFIYRTDNKREQYAYMFFGGDNRAALTEPEKATWEPIREALNSIEYMPMEPVEERPVYRDAMASIEAIIDGSYMESKGAEIAPKGEEVA